MTKFIHNETTVQKYIILPSIIHYTRILRGDFFFWKPTSWWFDVIYYNTKLTVYVLAIGKYGKYILLTLKSQRAEYTEHMPQTACQLGHEWWDLEDQMRRQVPEQQASLGN